MRLLLVISLAVWCSAYTLGDRLLLQINNRSYTQRQLEAHMLIREALRITSQSLATPIISAQRWRDLLELFREDMLILLELERYDRYRPSEADVEAARHYVLQKQALLRADLARLNIGDAMLTELIIVNLKISSYRRAQDKSTTPTKPRWLQKIEQHNFVRFYRGSSLWMPITPHIKIFPSPKLQD